MGSDSSKSTFEYLDSDNNGILTLSDFLKEHVFAGMDSPLLLWRFDTSNDGAMDYKEFNNLLQHIKSAQKKVRKLKKQGKICSSTEQLVWTSVTRETANEYDLDRDSETPAFTGRKPEELESVNQQNSNIKKSEEEIDMLYIKDIEEQVKTEAKLFLDRIISTEKGRKKFIKWLFKLVDQKQSNHIGVEDLAPFIKALRKDGISPEDLTFNSNINKAKNEDQDKHVAQLLMDEYDVNQNGYLTEKDFKVLANLIVSNYQSKKFLDQNKRIGPYMLKHKLGEGSVGCVRYGVHYLTREPFAIKIVKKGDVNDLTRLDTEIKAMMMLKHKNILKLEGVMESDDNVFFIMELCGGGTLYEYMNGKKLPANLARFFFNQVVTGVSYCHQQGVCHRDLKLDNLLLDNNGDIKISDFGHAGIFQKGWDLFSTSLVGGLCHITPEQLCGQPYSGEKSDTWSLGVILYQILTAKPPFIGSGIEMVENIKEVNFSYPENVDISEDAKDLVNNLLVKEPENRLTALQIKEHPWMHRNRKSPLLTKFKIEIDYENWKDQSIVKTVCEKLEKIGIPTNYCEEDEQQGKSISCRSPEMQIKFNFQLKKNKKNKDVLFFELVEGFESREFLSMKIKLLNQIDRMKINVQKMYKDQEQKNAKFRDSSSKKTNPNSNSTTPLMSRQNSKEKVKDKAKSDKGKHSPVSRSISQKSKERKRSTSDAKAENEKKKEKDKTYKREKSKEGKKKQDTFAGMLSKSAEIISKEFSFAPKEKIKKENDNPSEERDLATIPSESSEVHHETRNETKKEVYKNEAKNLEIIITAFEENNNELNDSEDAKEIKHRKTRVNRSRSKKQKDECSSSESEEQKIKKQETKKTQRSPITGENDTYEDPKPIKTNQIKIKSKSPHPKQKNKTKDNIKTLSNLSGGFSRSAELLHLVRLKELEQNNESSSYSGQS